MDLIFKVTTRQRNSIDAVWSHYRVLARNAEEAARKAKGEFMRGEFVSDVEYLGTLDRR
jgi:hypothetical protein